MIKRIVNEVFQKLRVQPITSPETGCYERLHEVRVTAVVQVQALAGERFTE